MKFAFLLFTNMFLLSITLQAFFSNSEPVGNKEFPLIVPISVEKPSLSSTGILDSDNDGVSDEEDKCSNTLDGEKVDTSGCRILNDKDKDGIPNKDDKCPNTSFGADVNEKGCELDSDKDGIVDSADKCPQTSKEFIVDKYGCPQTAILKIQFKSYKYNITKKSMPQVIEFANFLKENLAYQVVIYGYTDSSGRGNKKLSQKRAESVMKELIKQGLKITRFTAIGMGSKNPIATNETKEGRAKNRRIEIELLQ